ncbi:MAG: cobalamin-dependent protein [Deltaproteobacteria bacterium]|nr:cobalamin-dependent protein [Deltaproteobacteria bacterium]MCL5791662.1 cobalamin-dependent protein [Deltaproteobacteria bacterium]
MPAIKKAGVNGLIYKTCDGVNEKMKVLLLATNRLTTPYPVYPIGLDYVAGAITPPHKTHIIDLCFEGDEPDKIETRIREFAPDIVGLSLRNVDTSDSINTQQFIDQYKDVISMVRRATRAQVVLGGSAFSIFPEQFMQTLDAEYGIVGDGERLAQLVDAIEKGDDVSALPGVIVNPGFKSTAFSNGVNGGKMTENSSLWEGTVTRAFDKNRPYLNFYLKNGGILNLQTKRGCPFRCIYCTYPLIDGSYMRCFEPESVGRTARELQDAGAKFIYITDSSFNADVAHSIAVAEAFVRNRISIPWGGFFTPRHLPADYFRKMADCGLTHVEFGTDALCDATLSSYHKPFKLEQVFESHRMARDAGLFVAHYLIVGGPGENEQTLKETLDNAEKLEQTVLFFFFRMRIYPGTFLHTIALNEGNPEYNDVFTRQVFYQTDPMWNNMIVRTVRERSHGRPNWITGSGGENMEKVISRMYSRGRTGPLWEKLIQ